MLDQLTEQSTSFHLRCEGRCRQEFEELIVVVLGYRPTGRKLRVLGEDRQLLYETDELEPVSANMCYHCIPEHLRPRISAENLSAA